MCWVDVFNASYLKGNEVQYITFLCYFKANVAGCVYTRDNSGQRSWLLGLTGSAQASRGVGSRFDPWAGQFQHCYNGAQSRFSAAVMQYLST